MLQVHGDIFSWLLLAKWYTYAGASCTHIVLPGIDSTCCCACDTTQCQSVSDGWVMAEWLARCPAARCLWDCVAHASKLESIPWSNSLIYSIYPASIPNKHGSMSPPAAEYRAWMSNFIPNLMCTKHYLNLWWPRSMTPYAALGCDKFIVKL